MSRLTRIKILLYKIPRGNFVSSESLEPTQVGGGKAVDAIGRQGPEALRTAPAWHEIYVPGPRSPNSSDRKNGRKAHGHVGGLARPALQAPKPGGFCPGGGAPGAQTLVCCAGSTGWESGALASCIFALCPLTPRATLCCNSQRHREALLWTEPSPRKHRLTYLCPM